MVNIYTAVYGNYDKLKAQPKQDIECKFTCFTDNANLDKEDNTWDIVVEEGWSKNPRMSAKLFKMKQYFGDGDISIWIDGSARIKTESFAKDLVKMLGKDNFLLFRHPENRIDIYQEAEYCYQMPKYINQKILQQVQYYKGQGFPEGTGLYACGLLVRRQNKCVEINEEWWNENLEWTYQDQLSLPYVAWKLGFKLKMIKLNQYDNYLIDFLNVHSSNF